MIENIELEKGIHAALNYFKLIKLESITKNESYEVFKLFGGEDIFKTFEKDFNEGIIRGYYHNYEISADLYNYVSLLKTGRYSVSPLLLMELKNIDWIKDLDVLIDGNESIFNTIINNASSEVRRNLLYPCPLFDKLDCSTNLIINSYLNKSASIVKKMK